MHVSPDCICGYYVIFGLARTDIVITEIDRRTWAEAFWWGEVEAELRDLDLITYRFEEKSSRESCMAVIEDKRKESLYPHLESDCHEGFS